MTSATMGMSGRAKSPMGPGGNPQGQRGDGHNLSQMNSQRDKPS
jgi:hypothetical protein